MTLEELSWYIDNTIAKRLLAVDGVAAVNRTGGVDRTIRVILDPGALQAQGITAAQVNQQLRQSNLNAAGGRAEIAGSEQSVRVLGNAADAYAAVTDPDCAPRRPLRPPRRPRPGQGLLFRAANHRQAERPAGRQLPGPARQGRVGSVDL